MSIRKGKKRRSQEGDSSVSDKLSALPAKSPTFSWWKTLLAIGFLFGVSACLNCIGLSWGQPNDSPWEPDSIAGARTIYHTPNLFGQWRHKYPPFHFMVNAAAYKPFLNHWRKNPVAGGRQIGREVLNTEQISTLIMVSRIISVLMGAGAVVAVFLTARVLFDDDLTAFFSGLALAFSMLFVFYNHTGKPDAPRTFWFAWSLYWAVKAAYVGRWRHFALLGLFCSLAVCTKDSAAGYVVGLAIAVWIAMIGRARDAGKSFNKALTTVFSMKVLTAVVVAVFCFALINNVLFAPEAFLKRMGHWVGGTGITAYQGDFEGQLSLLWKTFKNFYYALGWPLLLAVMISLVYCLIKFRWESAFAVIPLIVFYLMVIVNIRFSYPRFLLPAFPSLALITGKTSADWCRWRKMPIMVKVFPLAFVYVLSLLYCIGLDLEFVQETRYKAEEWLASHVSRNERVVALVGASYAPRIHMIGRKYDFVMYRPRDEELLKKIRSHANYLVLSERELRIPDAFDQDFLTALLEGKMGYKEVARFSNKYLYPQKTIFGFAGWPFRRPNVVSPEIIILKRER